jgi:hypothetical protein
MLKLLLFVYIALMPFLHAFSLLPIVAANAVILAIATPFVLFRRLPVGLSFSGTNFLLLCVWIYGVTAWLWQPFDVLQDRWQSAFQWAFSFGFLWVVVRRWIIVSKVNFFSISATSFFTAIFLGSSSFFEFVFVNQTGLFISDFIPFSIEDFPHANIFGSTLLRPRVFSAEAGFSSMILEFLVPLSAVYFLKANNVLRIAFVISTGLGLISLFSAASILSIVSAIVILGIIRGSFSIVKILGAVGLIFALLFFILGIDIGSLPFYKIFEFFEESNYYLTEGSRQETLAAGTTLILQNPIGLGWGTVLQESKIPGTEIDRMIFGSGLISLWLELAVAVGFFVALAVIWHVCGILAGLSRVRGAAADSSFVCLCSLGLHHLAVFESWFPMFWFALALAQVLIAEASNSAVLQSGGVAVAEKKISGRHVGAVAGNRYEC